MTSQKRYGFVLAMAVMALLVVGFPVSVRAAQPPWVEPRALNIVEIAGQVPDSVLRDNILVYSNAGGIIRFVSSQISGDHLQITARVDTRYWGGSTAIPMLGQRALLDHMGSAAPQMWVRLYDARNNTEITNKVATAWYTPATLALPLLNTTAGDGRYPNPQTNDLPKEALGVRLPANYGGEMYLGGNYPVVNAVFTVPLQQRSRVTYLGTQEETFQSYVGPGYAGTLSALAAQLNARYKQRTGQSTRQPHIPLHIPARANYVMFTYPPMPFDVYDTTKANLQRPVGNSTRLALTSQQGSGAPLSTDLIYGGAFPLQAAWRDTDQVTSGSYLPQLSSIAPVDAMTPPEQVVAAGTAYDPCFLAGNCSTAVLDAILDARMPLQIIYLQVAAISTPDVVALPLRMPSRNWSAGQGVAASHAADGGSAGVAPVAQPSRVQAGSPGATQALSGGLPRLPLIMEGSRQYLPFVLAAKPTPTLPPPSGRPGGYFDSVSGMMIGYSE